MILSWLMTMGLAVGAPMDHYKKEITEWRAEQEKKLRADDGWLTVVGLHWLHEGKQNVDDLGEVELKGGEVKITKDGTVLKSDLTGDPTRIKRGTKTFYLIDRSGKLAIRVKDSASSARKNFKGRKWFPVDPALRIEANWVPYDEPRKLTFADITGNTQEEKSPGQAVFEWKGQKYSLVPVQDEDSLHFIFRDKTSGKETYGAARFLWAEAPKNGKVVLDFNRAVSPPCAFTKFATCPLPPRENWMKTEIRAGEMKLADH